MPHRGPIVIVEDDLEDQDDLTYVLGMIGVQNELHFFENGKQALDYLVSTSRRPFLILCDINMPYMNGLELRKEICKNKSLTQKSIPFVFLTTSSNQEEVKKAYELTVQGYFQKPHTLPQLKKTLQHVIDYWSECKHPNMN